MEFAKSYVNRRHLLDGIVTIGRIHYNYFVFGNFVSVVFLIYYM